MIINLSDLLDEVTISLDFDRKLDLDTLKVNGRDIYFTTPIKVNGSIYKASKDIVIDGQILYNYKENCARCLKEFKKSVRTKLSGKLVNENRIDEEDVEADDVVIEYNNRHINLERAVINEVILALPMKSLCSSDCKGICQKCGKNLNEGKCDCEIDDIDPRLAKLKELL
ncbi:MAG TPA: DUF177 domain-containing protein [Tissierellales bacterium]|nr:DUF177 domain-containing protein [Tissierellales bacterium]